MNETTPKPSEAAQATSLAGCPVHDLRMKLLELYYSAAATNRQAFLDVVQKFARNHDYLPPDQWDKVAFMGRQIASESPLFAEESTADDDDLADCA